MKILYISCSTIPSRTANSIHVMKMCQAFSLHGHEVILLAPSKKKEMLKDVHDVYQYYGVCKNFKLKKIIWPNIKGKHYICGWMAAKYAKNEKADIVYCRDLIGCYFASLMGLNVIYESHSPINNNKIINEIIFKRLIRKCNFLKLVVITKSLREYFEYSYPELTGITQVAPDGASLTTKNKVTYKSGKKDEKLQVGYVGHLYKGKGMEIIRDLLPKCKFANFHIVGGKEKDIDKWSTELSVYDNVKFHGYKPQDQIPKYLKSFDALLLPNKKKVYSNAGCEIGEWTSPLKLFEYMAAAKPIIASDLPVLKEILENGKNAILCDPDNINEWKDALLKIKNDRNFGKIIADNAYYDLKNNYTWKKRAEKILNEYAKP